MGDDPIFSVGGDLAFNWMYDDNGHRIVPTGGHLSAENVNDDNTHGLGNDYWHTGNNNMWAHDASVIQDCPLDSCTNIVIQGTDCADGETFNPGPVYVSSLPIASASSHPSTKPM
eukprot:sb/3476783/